MVKDYTYVLSYLYLILRVEKRFCPFALGVNLTNKRCIKCFL